MNTRALLLLAWVLPTLACDRGPTGSGSAPHVYPQAPVVLISIDTLRADRLPAYGYGGVETPAIDALAGDGILFERAYTHYPLTLPAHASLLTGLLPSEHGVRDNVGYRLDTSAVPFLPRWLREKGYRTGGAVSAYLLRADTGMGEGFEFYEDSFSLRGGVALGQNQRPGAETTRRAVEWLETVAGEPFFLFLHIYDPHTPWEPPEPYASRYDDPYDGEVAAADAVIGQLVADLERLGVYDRSIIVLVSDHGEGLSDHGELEHGILLYREVLEVPLLLKLPGGRQAGTRVAAPAQLADVLPTIQSLLGEAARETTLLDLLGPSPPRRPIYSETYYPRLHLGWSDLASLVEGDLHYIEGPDPELYDLAADPGERQNILAQRRDDYWTLRDKTAPLRKELAAPAAVDAETLARLETLGYLGSTVETGDGPLPDPKSQLHVLNDLMTAFHLQSARRYAQAIELFEKVVAENPGLVDAWENLAQCRHRAGRYSEAVAAYEKALELSRGADHVALGAARLLRDMERWDDSRRHAELALATNPAAAHLELAQTAFTQEDFGTAVTEAGAALAARPNAVAPHILLAQVAVERDEIEAAAEHIARAEREEAKRQAEEVSGGLHFMKGNIAARRGDARAAEESFLAEIRRHPGDTRAYSSLALLYALEERNAQAVAVLRQMVESNETPAAYAAAVDTLRVLGDPRSAAGLLRLALSRFPGNAKLAALAESP